MGRAAHVAVVAGFHNRRDVLVSDHAHILRQIEALLEPGRTPVLEELEETLTSGYAAALALEAERWRIERGIAEAAATLGDGESGTTQELARLGRRLRVAADDLAKLRSLLGTLRDRADAARAAAAVPS
jgi:hypothetical protein